MFFCLTATVGECSQSIIDYGNLQDHWNTMTDMAKKFRRQNNKIISFRDMATVIHGESHIFNWKILTLEKTN